MIAPSCSAHRGGQERHRCPLWPLFQQFGVNHLLVISGLHVGLVAAAGYLLGGLVQRLLLLAGWVHASAAGAAGAAAWCWLTRPWPDFRCPPSEPCACCCAYPGRPGRAQQQFRQQSAAGGRGGAGASIRWRRWAAASGCHSGQWPLCCGWPAGSRPGRRWQRLLGTHGFMSLVMLPLGALVVWRQQPGRRAWPTC